MPPNPRQRRDRDVRLIDSPALAIVFSQMMFQGARRFGAIIEMTFQRFCVLAAVAVFLSACGENKDRPPPPPPPLTYVLTPGIDPSASTYVTPLPGTYVLEPGQSVTSGSVQFTCSDGQAAAPCRVTITPANNPQGFVATYTGGLATMMHSEAYVEQLADRSSSDPTARAGIDPSAPSYTTPTPGTFILEPGQSEVDGSILFTCKSAEDGPDCIVTVATADTVTGFTVISTGGLVTIGHSAAYAEDLARQTSSSSILALTIEDSSRPTRLRQALSGTRAERPIRHGDLAVSQSFSHGDAGTARFVRVNRQDWTALVSDPDGTNAILLDASSGTPQALAAMVEDDPRYRFESASFSDDVVRGVLQAHFRDDSRIDEISTDERAVLPDWLVAGWWMSAPAVDRLEVGVFADAPEIRGAAFPELSVLSGSANYEGKVLGIYAKELTSGTTDAGSFSAGVELQANFGTGSIRGCIGCGNGILLSPLMDLPSASSEHLDVSLALPDATFNAGDGRFDATGVTASSPTLQITSSDGAWGGAFSRRLVDGHPRMALGTMSGGWDTPGGSTHLAGSWFGLHPAYGTFVPLPDGQ